MERNYNKLILDKLEEYSQAYNKSIERCSMSFTEKHIHDYRVSIRRLGSLLSFMYGYVPNIYILNLLGYLKSKMKLLSPLRDIQVQLLRISAFENKYSDLQDFYFYLFRKENTLIDKIKSKIVENQKKEIQINFIWLKLKLSEVLKNRTISDDDFLYEYQKLKKDVEVKMNFIDKDNDEDNP